MRHEEIACSQGIPGVPWGQFGFESPPAAPADTRDAVGSAMLRGVCGRARPRIRAHRDKEDAVADPHDTERELDTATLTDDDIRNELDDDTDAGDADGDDQDTVDGDADDQDADADDAGF